MEPIYKNQMNYNNGTLIFSPSDLTLYMESAFASWMEHYAILDPETTPEPDQSDVMMQLLQTKGNVHELATLTKLKAKGLSIADLSNININVALENTINAMQSGVDVIFQASLSKRPFHGRADFLVKVLGESMLGNYHYEIWDTKLSKTVKPNFIMQLCCYAEMLEELQGCLPNNISIILGNNEQVRLKTNNFFYYYQQLKNSFLLAHNNFNPSVRPDPTDSKSWGRWSNYVESLLLELDHLSQIANITRSQVKKLNKYGIQTMEQLVASENVRIPGININVLTRLKAQAKIQKDSFGKYPPLFQIRDAKANKKQGLALLPPHSPLDIFFDIEGFPLEEGGLEYLWGSVFFDENGDRQFKDLWAHNKKEEQQAFKDFINWVYLRWQQDPTMHIYHYANYEIAACRKLMGRYGVCEYEVDQLLRNEVFVDLYKIVKVGLLLGEPRYSIKNVEHLYRGKRNTAVGTGDESIVFYDNWREIPDGDSWQTSKILNFIREYNIDDCNSTQELVAWLRERQSSDNIKYIGKTKIIEPESKEEISLSIQLQDALLHRANQLTLENHQDATVAEIFAWSLEFHRRENKPLFWRFFDRLGMEDHELLDDFDCLANCMRTNTAPFKPTAKARNFAYEYKFEPDQEFKGIAETYYILGEETEDGKKCKVTLIKEHSNFAKGIIVLQAKNEPPRVMSLVPDEYINPDPMPKSIYAQAKAFYDHQLSGAILDFLRRSAPNIMGHKAGDPIAPSNDVKARMAQIIKAVINLNNSYLVIQGPPGAGKTYTAMHIIAELLKLGNRIGICSNSHKAINNLLINTAQYCMDHKIKALFICTKNTDPILDQLKVKVLENGKLSLEIQNACVVGTTVWGFARDDLANTFDYLFIDEAGQVSTANLIAISRSTKNIVLMGDQMQLDQPSQGSHPAESGSSVLGYLLHDLPTIPEELGVFLGTTYRMHSAINHFISNAIYDGKLKTDLNNDQQTIRVPVGYNGVLNKEAGIIFRAVEHEGNTQASDEEVYEIKQLANELLGRIFTNKKGEQRAIDWEDLLFLAPYNHQVNKLRQSLDKQAKVGSVDQFQGQEAPVVFLSMCASDASESPRGINFLFDQRRLNVAISRAQCLVIVVANPKLSQFTAKSVEQLSLINIFCYLLQCGQPNPPENSNQQYILQKYREAAW